MNKKIRFLQNSTPVRTFRRFLRAEDGVAAIEYAALVGLGAFLTVPALALAGLKLADTYTAIQASIGAIDNTPTGSVPPPFGGNSPAAYDPGSPVEGQPPAPIAPEPIFTYSPPSP